MEIKDFGVASTQSSMEINTSINKQINSPFIGFHKIQNLQTSQKNMQKNNQHNIRNSTPNNFCLKSKQNPIPNLKIFINPFTTDEIKENFNKKRFLMDSEEILLNTRLPDYFTRQKLIDPKMRIILLDWVMEVCGQLSFKRSTYHSAVVLLDIFLSKIPDVQTNILQLIGVTCLIIAAKNEEIVIPSLEAFSHSTDFAYSTEDILKFEKKMLNILKWRIHFPTLAFWANYITSKWDKFAKEFSVKHTYDLNSSFKKIKLPNFRAKTDEEYYFFRNYFQIIDVISLDVDYLQFSEKVLCASVAYLLIGLYFKCFSIVQVAKDFWKDPATYSAFQDLNIIFQRFLINYLNIGLDIVIEYVALYVGFFFNLKFDYKMPALINESEGKMVRLNIKLINLFSV